MVKDLRVVYTAGSVQEAYLLRNRLEERGIRAIVANADLDGGATLGLWAREWMCLPRVAVDEEHAPAARQIAEEFDRSRRSQAAAEGDRTASGMAGDQVSVPGRGENPSGSWPRCPQCGAPRITKCPACGASGTSFPPADANEDPPSAVAPLLLCMQCDEPFTAEYAGDCEWCGHAFPDGFRPARPPQPERLPLALLLMAALALGVVAGLIAYFAILLSRYGA